MIRVLRLALDGLLALIGGSFRTIAHGTARFERRGMVRLADLPAALLESCVLLCRIVLKGGGEDLFVYAFSIALLVLFLLLR